jgi:hypothetical protein
MVIMIRKPGSTLVIVLCLGFAQSVFAQAAPEQLVQHCSQSLVDLVGTHLGIDGFSYPGFGVQPSFGNGGLIVSGRCKAWPYDKSKTIGAFSYQADRDEAIKTLIVVLIDAQKKKIDATYKGLIEGTDAVYLKSDSLWIDTARYDLAPGVRAFGLDVFSENPFSALHDGGVGPVRMLFVKDGKLLRPILSGFHLSEWTYGKDGGYCSNLEAAGGRNIEIVSIQNSIGISKFITNGYANLKIDTVTKTSDCNGKILKEKKTQYEKRYDGKRYD